MNRLQNLFVCIEHTICETRMEIPRMVSQFDSIGFSGRNKQQRQFISTLSMATTQECSDPSYLTVIN